MSVHTKEKSVFKKRIKLFTLIIFTLAIIILIMFSPVFAIKNVVVNGNISYTKNELIDKIDFQTENILFKEYFRYFDNVYRFDFYTQQRILESLPYIKKADITYSFPNTINISIIEREPVAYILKLGNNILVDDQGYLLAAIYEQDTELPWIDGIEFGEYVIGKPLEGSGREQLETVFFLFKLVKELDQFSDYKLFELIDGVDIKDVEKILFTLDDRVTVNIGDKNKLDYKIKSLKEIYFNKLKENDRGLIDFTRGRYPSYISEN